MIHSVDGERIAPGRRADRPTGDQMNGVVVGGTRSGDGIDDGRDGLTEYRTLGSYCHCHPESGAFDAFLDAL